MMTTTTYVGRTELELCFSLKTGPTKCLILDDDDDDDDNDDDDDDDNGDNDDGAAAADDDDDDSFIVIFCQEFSIQGRSVSSPDLGAIIAF